MKKVKMIVVLTMVGICCAGTIVALNKFLDKDTRKVSGFFDDVNYPEGWR